MGGYDAGSCVGSLSFKNNLIKFGLLKKTRQHTSNGSQYTRIIPQVVIIRVYYKKNNYHDILCQNDGQ